MGHETRTRISELSDVLLVSLLRRLRCASAHPDKTSEFIDAVLEEIRKRGIDEEHCRGENRFESRPSRGTPRGPGEA